MELNGKALADLKDRVDGTSHQGWPAAARICLAEGRRHNPLRQLDLFRHVDRGRIADPAARHGGSLRVGCFSQLGVVVAGQPARALQPRVLQSQTGSRGIADRKQIWWNEAAGKWVGNDVPDFKPDSNPKDHMGPFIMNPEGIGRLFAPIGVLADGPFPEHYEPIESPIKNPFHPNQSNNPLVKKFKTPFDKFGSPEEYSIVCTTYRLTEQYHYWTKNNPMNVQLIPEPFVEIPVELADEKGIRGTDKIKVISARGTYIAKAFVTRRLKPMMIDGKKVYQIGLPIHQGFRGIGEDEGRNARTPANLLTPAVTDPNAHTPESKGFLVKVEKA